MHTGNQGWRVALAQYIEQQAKPVEKFGHQPRLYALTRQIGVGLQYDDDVVYAAVWMHDVGVFVGHRPEERSLLEQWDMIGYALKVSPDLLNSLGFPAEKIPAVLESIRTHQPQFRPQTAEATLLRDADILEQLGAVGILRTVCKVGRDTRFDTFTQAVKSLQKALDTLPPLLILPSAQTLSAGRVCVLKEWLQAVEDEAGAMLL